MAGPNLFREAACDRGDASMSLCEAVHSSGDVSLAVLLTGFGGDLRLHTGDEGPTAAARQVVFVALGSVTSPLCVGLLLGVPTVNRDHGRRDQGTSGPGARRALSATTAQGCDVRW